MEMDEPARKAREHFSRARREAFEKGLAIARIGKRGAASVIFSRSGLVALLLLCQALLLVAVSVWLMPWASRFYLASAAVAAVAVLGIINSRMDSTAKITWLFLILLVPVFGILFYLYIRTDIGHRRLRRSAQRIMHSTRNALKQDPDTMRELRNAGSDIAGLVLYLRRTGCYPAWRNERSEYLASGEAFFESILHAIRSAKKFVFLEFFIIEDGLMWGRILEALAEKARSGVDVRVLYDGTCEFTKLPSGYPEILGKLKIRARVFSRIHPFVSTRYNYRDHRKILVVDGRVAYTGGVNLADEYINHIRPFGEWKDAALKVEGKAAASFTLMFLQMWHAEDERAEPGLLLELPEESGPKEARGFVIPFGDNPMDREKAGENLYIDMISRSNTYVHVMTPYFIPDGELESALKFAAARGVDVKIILPGASDKPILHELCLSFCASLIESGVKVYRWVPGFVHSKVMVSDGTKAIVGSVNLDYRSLYHHFECGAYLYKAPAVLEAERDISETLKCCVPVTLASLRNRPFWRKAAGALLRTIAPLL